MQMLRDIALANAFATLCTEDAGVMFIAKNGYVLSLRNEFSLKKNVTQLQRFIESTNDDKP